MKKVLFSIMIAFAMTSCYTSKVYVGNVQKEENLVKVEKKWNHFLIAGLIPVDAKHKANEVVLNNQNYVVKTSHSFLNMLVTALTFSIYSPTTTTFYLPIRENFPNNQSTMVESNDIKK